MTFDERNKVEEVQVKVRYMRTVTQQLHRALCESIENYEEFRGVDLTPVLSTPSDLLEVVCDYQMTIDNMLTDIIENVELKKEAETDE